MVKNRCASLFLLALALAGGTASVANAQDALAADKLVAREGEGARRAALNKRERSAFDAAWWAMLSDWQNGSALSNTAIQGKPVLVLTWSDYLPTATRAVATATKMAEKYAKQGLVVVMVHPDTEWASAKKPKGGDGQTILVAKDAKGDFRKALDVDQDPDFYVIDRAGQLRFADVALEGVDKACEIVTDEKAADATSLNDRVKTELNAADAASRKTNAINSQATFVNIPEIPFDKPKDKDYEDARWPKRPLDESKQQNEPGAQLPTNSVSLPDEGWFPKKPEMKGRVIVAYIFHPKFSRFDAWNKSIPMMDQLQRQYGRDVVVVGLLTRFEQLSGGGITLTDADKDPEKLAEAFTKYTQSRKFEHTIAKSFTTDLYAQARGANNTGETPVPAFLIISTDGVCRWFTHDKNRVQFDAALEQILRVDPGVQNRRKAEQEWLKNNGAGGN